MLAPASSEVNTIVYPLLNPGPRLPLLDLIPSTYFFCTTLSPAFSSKKLPGTTMSISVSLLPPLSSSLSFPHFSLPIIHSDLPIQGSNQPLFLHSYSTHCLRILETIPLVTIFLFPLFPQLTCRPIRISPTPHRS